MEPIFAEPVGDTVTAELRTQLDAAVAALPPARRLNPTENEPPTLEMQLWPGFKTGLLQKGLPSSPNQRRRIKDGLFEYI
jgi:hypothetical protein